MTFDIKYVVQMLVAVVIIQQPLMTFGQTVEYSNINNVDLRQYVAHPNVPIIDQDKNGFIWIASDFGLYRFDGKHVRQYTKSSYPELPSDVINSILVAPDNEIWLATDGGLAVLNTKHDRIERRAIELEDSVLNASIIPTSLFLASDSTIWLGLTQNGYARRDDNGNWQVYRFEVADFSMGSCFEVTRFFEDRAGDIYLQAICAHSIAFIHIDVQRDEPIARLMHRPNLESARIFSMNGDILLLDVKGLHQYHSETHTFESLTDKPLLADIPDFRPWNIEEETETTFLIGGLLGKLARCTIGRDTIIVDYFGKMTDGRIQAIFEDRSGCIWLGTKDGVFYMPDRNPRFQNHWSSAIYDERYGLRMRAIVEDLDGMIYACTNVGVYKFDPILSSVELVRPKALRITQPYAMCVDSTGVIRIGSDGYGIVKFDPDQNNFYDLMNLTGSPDQLAGLWIGELITDSDSTLWVGTSNGISYLLAGETKMRIARDFNNKRLLPNVFVHDIKMARKGQYWLGTSHGLFQLIRVGRGVDMHFILNKYEDIPYKVREVCMTAGTDVWLATEDAGLVHYSPTSKAQKKYDKSSGLPSDVLYSMVPGPKGEFWIGTFDGLARFDTATLMFSNFFVSDGLPHNEFNSQSQLIARNGMIYMGTQNGMVSFNPMDFGVDSSDLPLILNNLTIHNTRLDSTYEESRYTQLTAGIDVGPQDNLVTISYSIADYNKPDGNRFKYLLEGLYTKWHYVGSKTELVLPHLPPGDYILHLRGAGSDGRWSTSQAAIQITAHAVYYNTWWFRLISALLFVLAVWLVYRYRLNQVLKLQRIRLRIAEDLHDELGSSLTGIGIQTELLTVTESSTTRAAKLTEISGYIQDAVSKLGDIVWSLQSDTGSLGDLMDRIEEQTHLMLTPGKVECQLSMPHEFHDLILNELVKQNFFLIFKEALTNIVKHSNADKVTITMRCQDKELYLQIVDNGETRSPANAKSMGGNGLKNMQRRAKKMVAELNISKEDGFSVELRVPNAFARG